MMSLIECSSWMKETCAPKPRAKEDRYAKASVILRENLRHIIFSDKLLLVKLCEYPFSEGILYLFEVYLREPSKDAVLPVSVSE